MSEIGKMEESERSRQGGQTTEREKSEVER